MLNSYSVDLKKRESSMRDIVKKMMVDTQSPAINDVMKSLNAKLFFYSLRTNLQTNKINMHATVAENNGDINLYYSISLL
jgi:hypothetical protein